MIRWCAYCQRYQGEVEPYDDYRITHTICANCMSRGAYRSGEGADLQPLREFFARLANPGLGVLPSASEVIEEGAHLGIDPLDLLVGVVQPVLQQIGQRWLRSEITISEEHRVTALCGAVIESIASKEPSILALRDARPPDVLLVGAEGNFHTLGIQLVEVLLLRDRVSTFTVHPGIPAEEVLRLARVLGPKVIAISVALPTQVSSATWVAERVADWPESTRPRVAVGGHAISSWHISDARLFPCQDARALVELARMPRSGARRGEP
jgi:methanogenic corrinoid protein MtbC1